MEKLIRSVPITLVGELLADVLANTGGGLESPVGERWQLARIARKLGNQKNGPRHAQRPRRLRKTRRGEAANQALGDTNARVDRFPWRVPRTHESRVRMPGVLTDYRAWERVAHRRERLVVIDILRQAHIPPGMGE